MANFATDVKWKRCGPAAYQSEHPLLKPMTYRRLADGTWECTDIPNRRVVLPTRYEMQTELESYLENQFNTEL